MAPDHSNKIIHKIEAICEQGCTQINHLLDKAENGCKIEELSDFSPSEIKQIITELVEIMSVYDGECSTTEK